MFLPTVGAATEDEVKTAEHSGEGLAVSSTISSSAPAAAPWRPAKSVKFAHDALADSRAAKSVKFSHDALADSRVWEPLRSTFRSSSERALIQKAERIVREQEARAQRMRAEIKKRLPIELELVQAADVVAQADKGPFW